MKYVQKSAREEDHAGTLIDGKRLAKRFAADGKAGDQRCDPHAQKHCVYAQHPLELDHDDGGGCAGDNAADIAHHIVTEAADMRTFFLQSYLAFTVKKRDGHRRPPRSESLLRAFLARKAAENPVDEFHRFRRLVFLGDLYGLVDSRTVGDIRHIEDLVHADQVLQAPRRQERYRQSPRRQYQFGAGRPGGLREPVHRAAQKHHQQNAHRASHPLAQNGFGLFLQILKNLRDTAAQWVRRSQVRILQNVLRPLRQGVPQLVRYLGGGDRHC